jgi:hypothetical protein
MSTPRHDQRLEHAHHLLCGDGRGSVIPFTEIPAECTSKQHEATQWHHRIKWGVRAEHVLCVGYQTSALLMKLQEWMAGILRRQLEGN